MSFFSGKSAGTDRSQIERKSSMTRGKLFKKTVGSVVIVERKYDIQSFYVCVTFFFMFFLSILYLIDW